MPISTAVHKPSSNGGHVTIFNEKGSRVTDISVSPGDQLIGYTSTTVSVKKANGTVYLYNDKGSFIRSL